MSRRPSHEAAEAIAISGLGFLAAEPERLDRFLALSGLQPQDVRAAASTPGFLAGVLQHIMDDDRIAAAFGAEAGLSSEELTAAAMVLGGERQGWDTA
jgi:hypothetical protein